MVQCGGALAAVLLSARLVHFEREAVRLSNLDKHFLIEKNFLLTPE